MVLLLASIHPPVSGADAEPWSNRLDAQGRQSIPGGFVVLENINYTPDDDRRMVRMGANFQVIKSPVDARQPVGGDRPATGPCPSAFRRKPGVWVDEMGPRSGS